MTCMLAQPLDLVTPDEVSPTDDVIKADEPRLRRLVGRRAVFRLQPGDVVDTLGTSKVIALPHSRSSDL